MSRQVTPEDRYGPAVFVIAAPFPPNVLSLLSTPLPTPSSPTSFSFLSLTERYILSRSALRNLVAQVDPSQKLDDEAENVLLPPALPLLAHPPKLIMMLADEFVENVTTFAARLAKHRGSNKLEAKDLELHLSRAYDIHVPGISDATFQKPARPQVSSNAIHQQRMEDVQKHKYQRR